MLFFWNFLLRFGSERNGTIIFIFSHSQPLPSYFGLKWSHNSFFFLFFVFFCNVFGIFCYMSGRNGSERYYIFSLFLIIFQSILTWNEAIMLFFNFSNFFAIVLEFSITHRVGTKCNDDFYFFSFSTFSTLFWLQKKP